MWLYLSEKENFNDFADEDALVWHEANIPYAVWGQSSTRSLSMKYYPSEVQFGFIIKLDISNSGFLMVKR